MNRGQAPVGGTHTKTASLQNPRKELQGYKKLQENLKRRLYS